MLLSKVIWIFCIVIAVSGKPPSVQKFKEWYYFWVKSPDQTTFRFLQMNYMKSYMNTSAYLPCSDFYKYACDNFLRNGWREEENEYRRDVFTRLEVGKDYLIEKAIETITDDQMEIPFIHSLKDFYDSCMDTTTRQNQGLISLQLLLNSLGSWPILDLKWSEEDFYWLNVTAHAARFSADILIKNSVHLDYGFENRFLTYLDNPFSSQLSYARSISTFKIIVERIMQGVILEKKKINDLVDDIYNFYEKIHQISSRRADGEDASSFEKISVWELTQKIPQINWKTYLSIVQERDVSIYEMVVVQDMDYLDKLGRLIVSTEPRTLANYIFYALVSHYMHLIDSTSFYVGKERQLCISLVREHMGDALASLFLQYVHGNTVKYVENMFVEIQQAALEAVVQNNWIDEATKQGALNKINKIKILVGYPDHLTSNEILNSKYAKVDLHRERYIDNLLNLKKNSNRIMQAKVGWLLNESYWLKDPLDNKSYSEYYRQGMVVIPMGLLLPPFYHSYAPSFTNYGFLGTYIAHELMHAFDLTGLQYNSEGTTNPWITETLIEPAKKRFSCFIDQYKLYGYKKPFISVDSYKTLSENLSDNDGLKLASMAYEKWVQNNFELAKDELKDFTLFNMTSMQLFFLSFSQSHCSHNKATYIVNQVITENRAPQRFRVIGPLANNQGFSKEFECKLGMLMNPEIKCTYLNAV